MVETIIEVVGLSERRQHLSARLFVSSSLHFEEGVLVARVTREKSQNLKLTVNSSSTSWGLCEYSCDLSVGPIEGRHDGVIIILFF